MVGCIIGISSSKIVLSCTSGVPTVPSHAQNQQAWEKKNDVLPFFFCQVLCEVSIFIHSSFLMY